MTKFSESAVWVATWWYFWRDDGFVQNKTEAREEYLDTLAHELCHYDKWRREIDRNHRGLQKRVESLVRKFNEHPRRIAMA